MSSHVLELTNELISIPSTADRPRELERSITYVETFFKKTPNLFVRRYEKEGKPSIVVSTVDTLSPDILLLGHLDVVPADPSLFQPRQEGGLLYGRGACDMKSEDAVMMLLTQEAATQVSLPSIALMLTTDEEVGGQHGANYLINDMGYRCKIALVPDSGQGPNEVITSTKGILHARLMATGKAAHGSRPWLGENAIDKLLKTYASVRAQFPEITSSDTWHTTCTLGTIRGGHATNQVPDHAECTLDIRFTEDYTLKKILATLRDICHNCDVEIVVSGEASHTSSNHPALQLYSRLLQQELQQTAAFQKGHGGHDGRFLTAHGIPVLVSRPRSGAQHSPDEWLDIKSLEDYYRLYQSYLHQLTTNLLPSL